jgi:hypothetical protein
MTGSEIDYFHLIADLIQPAFPVCGIGGCGLGLLQGFGRSRGG